MKLILTAILCFICLGAGAQQLSYGIKAGIGATGSEETAWDVPPIRAEYRLSSGWGMGGFVKYQLRGGLYASGDLWYYNAGSMYVEEYNDSFYSNRNSNNYLSTSLTVRTNMLHMPLMLGYSFGQRKWRPYIKAGVATNYLMSATLEHRRYDQVSDEHQYAKHRVRASEVNYTGYTNSTSKWSFQPIATVGTMIGDKTGIEIHCNFGGKNLVVKNNQVKTYGFMIMLSRAISAPRE